MNARKILVAAALAAVVVTATERSASARLPDAENPKLEEHTAMTLGARTLKLGILAFEYGLTERITVGTDPPPWLLRTAVELFVPNLHLKFVVYEAEAFAVALKGAVYYARASDSGSGSQASLFVVPVSLLTSIRMHPQWWVHPELTFVSVTGNGAAAFDRVTIGGSAATRALQAGLMLEYRVQRAIALTLRGRYQLVTGDVSLNGSDNPDELTTVQVNAQLQPKNEHPWMVVPGVAFLWQRVRLGVGLGYGTYFVPGFNVPLSKKGLVPDATVAICF